MEYWKENEGKRAHDPLFHHSHYKEKDERCVSVLGPIIVGAGPSGLAVSACLKAKGISSLIIERSNCIASLWQLRTYDRLSLHLPKHYCELPLMPFPDNFPTYPTKQQFVGYLESYAKHFGIKPAFGRTVVRAEFDAKVGLWRMRTVAVEKEKEKEKEVVVEYGSRWLVVATGENAEIVVPEIDGLDEFKGLVMHSSSYKSGVEFSGKKVLVVGCGNSGMEVCLDLCNHNARPLIVVRDKVHVLPREMLGQSTFGLSLWLMKWLPIRLVDQFLLLLSWIKLGDTARLGLIRPNVGPLEFKSISGKTPVLDVGTLAKIKSGDIKVRPAIKRISDHGVEFESGRCDDIYAVIQATGYKSNVPSWLKEKEMFSDKDGLPRRPFPNGWKGERGLYAVGFTKKGLLGTSIDARKIADDIELSWRKVADDIEQSWKAKNKQLIGFSISAIMSCNQNK